MRERRRRVTRPMQLLIALLVGALGFAIVAQWREDEQRDFAGVRGAELGELLKSLDASNQRLSRQIAELTETRDELRDSTASDEQAEQAARKRADELAILAGTAPAAGPGIAVDIDGGQEVMTAAVLLDAIEELRDAGAEVLAVNGTARVVANTYFLDDRDGIRVGGRLLEPPFVIEAIGDPHTLDEAVYFRGGLADRVESKGGTVSVERRERLTITALADATEAQYARPASTDPEETP
ncbi:hypothetical protein BHE97_06210 [Aeromicrobium sp. PE09-221]|uniref:DUF881 domain-containing protein n=1 Tax=Aeromicrobium sp. PE09-221 TaxID=1898043 RepID=UPI000B6CBA7A|nr:DUF881 domain-containing protein [Aeromicrobium sp. PE09-221]OUZ11022.1 hypothetical protein BHE97_06210 [Aeromicrobium sp. PE09-221]